MKPKSPTRMEINVKARPAWMSEVIVIDWVCLLHCIWPVAWRIQCNHRPSHTWRDRGNLQRDLKNWRRCWLRLDVGEVIHKTWIPVFVVTSNLYAQLLMQKSKLNLKSFGAAFCKSKSGNCPCNAELYCYKLEFTWLWHYVVFNATSKWLCTVPTGLTATLVTNYSFFCQPQPTLNKLSYPLAPPCGPAVSDFKHSPQGITTVTRSKRYYFITSFNLDFLFLTETWLKVGDYGQLSELCPPELWVFELSPGLLVMVEALLLFLKISTNAAPCIVCWHLSTPTYIPLH